MCQSAQALDVGAISAFMPSEAAILSKEIKNTTESGRLVNIKIERISNPSESGVVIPLGSPDEMLLSPAKLIMPAHSREVIRFYYKGPDDNKERYYRIIWFDQALSEAGDNKTRRNAVATTSARIGTILVVTPRQAKFSHQFANNRITNTGNATFKMVAYGACKQRKDGANCKENYFVMPGQSSGLAKVDLVDKKSHLALWYGEQFIQVK
jgi:hypothetical protein